MNPSEPTPDHDLLIELRADVKNLNTNVTQFINSANPRFTSLEHRVGALEKDNEVEKGALNAKRDWGKTLQNIITLVAVLFTAYATWRLTK